MSRPFACNHTWHKINHRRVFKKCCQENVASLIIYISFLFPYKYTLYYLIADMQKVAATQPLVAEIFSDCERKKAGIPLNLWKLSDIKFYELTIFWHDDCEDTSIEVSERSKPAWFPIISCKYFKIQILATEGFKLSACLWLNLKL
jgi:hypothetical protein